MNGCLWLVAGVGLVAVALAVGVLPLWVVGLLAAPLAFLVGHWIGWRKASHAVEAAGHKKAATDGEQLRRGWRLL